MKRLILISSCFLLVSCTRNKSPTNTVKAFLEAGRKGDQGAPMAFLQKRDREFLQKMGAKHAGKQSPMPAPGTDYIIGKETISDEAATVIVTAIHDGKEKTDQLNLVKEGGQWRIDLVPDEMLDMLRGSEGILKDVTGR